MITKDGLEQVRHLKEDLDRFLQTFKQLCQQHGEPGWEKRIPKGSCIRFARRSSR